METERVSEQLSCDEAVKFLEAYPGEIEDAWNDPINHYAGAPFKYVTPDGMIHNSPEGRRYGCLTQVKNGTHVAFTKHLTDAIRSDERIPGDPADINVDNLHVFAEWRKRIYQELNSTPNNE